MSDGGDRRQWRVGESLRTRARGLRARTTEAEQRLWLELRAHRLDGLSFRRQHPIVGYVADFACLPLKLIIELDGGQHFERAGLVRDARRDQALAELGFHVLRFSNLDVLQNMTGVLETIVATAKARVLPPPSPASGRGRASATGSSVELNSGGTNLSSAVGEGTPSDIPAPPARSGAK